MLIPVEPSAMSTGLRFFTGGLGMTDTNQNPDDADGLDQSTGAGVKRPDQGGTNQPGQDVEGPASGGEGAAGAGGPDGFGRGT